MSDGNGFEDKAYGVVGRCAVVILVLKIPVIQHKESRTIRVAFVGEEAYHCIVK